MKKIVAFFVRHGETDLNKKNDFRGDLDVDINEEGQKQAEQLVPFFANRQFSAAYGSTRKRVEQTLRPLLESKGMAMKPLKALDSLDTGEFAGKPKDKENLKELKWYREHPEETIPGGEKVATFQKRTDAKIMQLIHKGESSNKPVLVGVHGSVIKELGRLLHDDMDYSKVEPGGVVAVFKSPQGYTAEPILKDSSQEPEEIYAGS
jgi:broad specificity phosphatase PhoE